MMLSWSAPQEEDFSTMSMMNERFSSIRDGKIFYGSGNWRQSNEYYDCDEYGGADLCFYYGVFWNGAVHWVSQTGPFLCFEVGNCSFRQMPTPPIPEEQWHRNIEYFGECGGHLHLIHHNDNQSTEFDILELEVNYSGWFVKYHVNLEFLPNLHPVMVNQETNPPEEYAYTNVFSMICFHDDEKDKARLLLSIPGKIILYDMNDGVIEELADVKPASFRLFIDGARYDGFEFTNMLRLWLVFEFLFSVSFQSKGHV
nr:F-box protein At5g07610-like isoform X3 [Nicotiana tomentosiformis]